MFGIFQGWRPWRYPSVLLTGLSPDAPSHDIPKFQTLMSISFSAFSNDCNLLKSDHLVIPVLFHFDLRCGCSALNLSCHSVQRQPWSSAGKATPNSTLTNCCAHPSGVQCGLSSPFQGPSGTPMHSFRIATSIIFSPTTRNAAKPRNLAKRWLLWHLFMSVPKAVEGSTMMRGLVQQRLTSGKTPVFFKAFTSI